MHRAHEELCKMAMEAVDADGVLIHMLLGKLKPGDILRQCVMRRSAKWWSSISRKIP